MQDSVCDGTQVVKEYNVYTLVTATMSLWCIPKEIPAPVQGFGVSITLAAFLCHEHTFVFVGSILCLLIHECILVGYATPLMTTVIYVAVAHILGYVLVLFLYGVFHRDSLLITAALGVTVILVGTILSIFQRMYTTRCIDSIPPTVRPPAVVVVPKTAVLSNTQSLRERNTTTFAPKEESNSVSIRPENIDAFF